MFVETAAAITAFIAVTALAYAIFSSRTGLRAAEHRIAVLKKAQAEDNALGDGVLKRGGSSLPLLRLIASEETALNLQRAGSSLRVSEFFLIRLLVTVLSALVMVLLFRGSAAGLVLGVIGGVAGFIAPALWMTYRRSRRLGAINKQLVEMMTLISNALRSGFAFTQAVELASKQLEAPIKDELDQMLRDSSLGARPEDALKGFADRTGSLDVEMMVTTILVQRTTGGNLSEILDNVAETIRERARLLGEIRALTAQQRLTGLVLGIYPVALGALFTLIAYDLMKVLWTTEAGIILLSIAIFLQGLGMFTINRILQLDV